MLRAMPPPIILNIAMNKLPNINMLNIKNLSVNYGDVSVLDDIDLPLDFNKLIIMVL